MVLLIDDWNLPDRDIWQFKTLKTYDCTSGAINCTSLCTNLSVTAMATTKDVITSGVGSTSRYGWNKRTIKGADHYDFTTGELINHYPRNTLLCRISMGERCESWQYQRLTELIASSLSFGYGTKEGT